MDNPFKSSDLSPKTVWIDTDPSIGLPLHDADDAFALTLAAASSELDIAGISAAYGNTSLTRGMRITQEWAHYAGFDAQRIHEGASMAGQREQTDAMVALTKVLEATQEPLTYLALAPLTNLAGLLRERHDLAAKIDCVIFVGGRTPGRTLRIGSRIPYTFHDANFEKDPEAMEFLLSLGLTWRFLAVEIGPLCMLTRNDFETMAAGSAASRWLARKGRGWLWGWRWGFGLEGAPCFDLLAIGSLIFPEMFTWQKRKMSVSKETKPPLLLAAGEGEGVSAEFCTGVSPIFRPQSLDRICR